MQTFGIGGGGVATGVCSEGCASSPEIFKTFYAEKNAFCAKFLLGYKMRPVNKGRPPPAFLNPPLILNRRPYVIAPS